MMMTCLAPVLPISPISPVPTTQILAEASPTDTTWGIGMDANDLHVDRPECWRGRNLLGEVLMYVRTKIRWERPDLAERPGAQVVPGSLPARRVSLGAATPHTATVPTLAQGAQDAPPLPLATVNGVDTRILHALSIPYGAAAPPPIVTPAVPSLLPVTQGSAGSSLASPGTAPDAPSSATAPGSSLATPGSALNVLDSASAVPGIAPDATKAQHVNNIHAPLSGQQNGKG